MDSLRAEVANSEGIVLGEDVFDLKVVVDRIRKNLIDDVGARQFSGLIDRQIARGRIGQDAARSQKASWRRKRAGNIERRAELRWQRERSYVVKEDVVGHAETGANDGVLARAGSVGEANARRDGVLLGFRRAEGDQSRNIRNCIHAL